MRSYWKAQSQGLARRIALYSWGAAYTGGEGALRLAARGVCGCVRNRRAEPPLLSPYSDARRRAMLGTLGWKEGEEGRVIEPF